MANLKATRGMQTPLSAEFTFNVTDTMVNAAGASDGFATVADHVFDVINLPQGAVIILGDVTTEVAVVGATAYNIKVGDATSDVRYLGVTNKVAAGRTALVPTGYVSNGEQLRITVSPTVATATAGKVTVRLNYIVRNRASEVQSH